ncbi:MAG TPA: DNA repair protein RecO [bacterium]|nr:DNA repair protein RecO [bacterium]
MSSITTSALVLRHVKQGDTSHVVTLLTREGGKIAVMAKGNRKPGSRFGAGLELFNLSRVMYRERANRDLQFLEGCELERNYERLRHDVFGYAAAGACAELTDRIVPEGAASIEIFDLLATALDVLEQVVPLPEGEELRAVAFPVAFQLKLMDEMGVAPEMAECASCGTSDIGNSAALSARRGGILCKRCRAAEGGRSLGAETVDFLRSALYGELSQAFTAARPPSRTVVLEARGALDAVLEFHHGKPAMLRSRKFLDELWK